LISPWSIAVSAYFTPTDQERGREAGFDMYFSKPVDLMSLRLALARIGSVFPPKRAAAQNDGALSSTG
jgi:CheY-like chemotaxis protein